MRVLLVEDDAKLAGVIARVLAMERIAVDRASDGDAGLDLALSDAYDVVVLDRMLPGRDGMAVLAAIRRHRVGVPVLMLTALGDLPSRVEGLDAGADDYLVKPFAFAELLARLRTLARRGERPTLPERVEVGRVAINLAGRTVHRDGSMVDLSPREWAVLELLARNRGRVLSRDRVLERVWGPDADPLGNAVDLHVHYLRRKLDVPGEPSIVRTVRGAGYELRPDG